MIDGNRLQFLMKEQGLSQQALAERVGVKQPTINRLVHGEQGGTKFLHLIAAELGTTAHYLTGEIDEPYPEDGYRPPAKDINSVEVQEIDLAYGMGGQYLDDIPVKANTVRFTRDWLRNFTDAKPDDLFFARGIGNSMMPTILDSDIVLIDRSQDSMRMNDQIWALSFGGMGMIKRLRSMPDGSLRIMSDNASVREDRATDDEAHLIGRVVAVVRKI